MAALAATQPIKTLSRSTFCAKACVGTKSRCRRLDQHHGDCRPTMKSPAIVKAVKTVKTRKAAKARKVAPKVITIPMAEYRRLVAASPKRVKRERFVNSGKPSARLA